MGISGALLIQIHVLLMCVIALLFLQNGSMRFRGLDGEGRRTYVLGTKTVREWGKDLEVCI